MKRYVQILFLFFCNYSFGQSLHHFVLSAQVKSQTINSGMMVLENIGRQSVNGNNTESILTMLKGFKQSLISQFYPMCNVNKWSTTICPNPFATTINISLSAPITDDLIFSIFKNSKHFNS